MATDPLARRLHHVGFRTPDLDAAIERWTSLWCMTLVERDDKLALLRCTDEDYGIELIAATDAGFDHAAYELPKGMTSRDARMAILQRCGISPEHRIGPFGRPDQVRLSDPQGNGVELVEYVAPADARPYEAKLDGSAHPMHPRRVAHVNMLSENVHELVDFYTRMLGFRVSDWIGDGACWLHVDPTHHVLAFLRKEPAHFHHVAFDYIDFAAMRAQLDHVAQFDRACIWGPGRHSMAQNLFAYVRMPEDDCFVELYCDMEIVRDDHEPRQWPDDVHSSNAWGTLPPRTYFRFDDDAIRVEREQLINLGKEFIPA